VAGIICQALLAAAEAAAAAVLAANMAINGLKLAAPGGICGIWGKAAGICWWAAWGGYS